MGNQERVTETKAISEVKNALSEVVNAVGCHETRLVIEKRGSPVAAIVSAADLDRLVRYEHERDERFKLIDRMRESFKDVPDEEIEREADRAVAEIRGKIPTTREQQEPGDLWAVVARMREAFKDVPPEEIERETDRIIGRIRADNRAAREAMAATG